MRAVDAEHSVLDVKLRRERVPSFDRYPFRCRRVQASHAPVRISGSAVARLSRLLCVRLSGYRTPMPRTVAAPRKSILRRLTRWMLIAILVWIAFTWLTVLLLRFVAPPTSAFMLERRWQAAREGQSGFIVRYQWVPIDKVAPELPISLVAAEDQKFPVHHGFDVQAIQDALDDAEAGERLRGASTISQQTAKNLFLWGGRSFVRKGLEVYFTALLEITWPKRRILEVYLNIAEFGDGIYGAEAASQQSFRTSSARLTARQAALLAAVLPSPKRYHAERPSPWVARHADWIEQQVHQLGGPGYLERH
jgi:monofunctional biosynthetic peptidoglycan transglycosylase